MASPPSFIKCQNVQIGEYAIDFVVKFPWYTVFDSSNHEQGRGYRRVFPIFVKKGFFLT
jgi:hypothetical protein